jgi:soluble lytic murein transglycosylase-like protein
VGDATVSVRQADQSTSIEVEARTDGTAPVVQEVTVHARSGESESDGASAVGGVSGVAAPTPIESVSGALTIEERDRILRSRPASGGPGMSPGGVPGVSRERELRIAREGIVARPVGRISKDEYERLYKVSAARYGFREDWYVLAAVGWVESQHGENMGPSSAGAMGPMQFLPSTWKVSGMDGNRDGVANVMDPRDAIPAAARYLKRGGAPGDWRAALYTYNHAGWYVEKVLDSAERYRTLAKDDKAGPYR